LIRLSLVAFHLLFNLAQAWHCLTITITAPDHAFNERPSLSHYLGLTSSLIEPYTACTILHPLIQVAIFLIPCTPLCLLDTSEFWHETQTNLKTRCHLHTKMRLHCRMARECRVPRGDLGRRLVRWVSCGYHERETLPHQEWLTEFTESCRQCVRVLLMGTREQQQKYTALIRQFIYCILG